MKKSLLALAALTAFAGVASAQSSVTLYGRVDLAAGKRIASDQDEISNGSGSRLGLRGVEDLGGGLQTIFNIEHRFNADTGADTTGGTRHWNGRSFVGLKGGFGQVVLGREYTTTFLGNQLLADPWGWDTIAANNLITGLGGIAKVRNDSSITYNIGMGGFSFGAQYAEATDSINQFDSNPYNFNVSYRGGPLFAAAGWEHTGRNAGTDEEMWSIVAQYNFGFVKPGFFYGEGDFQNGDKHKGWMVTATAPLGAGELRASYGELDSDALSEKVSKQFGIGYHYSMSKRTTLYVDYANDSGARTDPSGEESGYNVGIKHNF